jgi:diaminopimelate epimerase
MALSFPFTKMEGCGNDFVVVRRGAIPDDLGPSDAPVLCNRRTGVGADGVIVLSDGPTMEIWNADGSIAEMCGNGLRCLVRRIVEDGSWNGRGELQIVTGAGPLRARLVGDEIEVEMGPPRHGGPLEVEVPLPLPLGGEGRLLVRGHRVSMGNPHFVVFAEDAAGRAVGPPAPALPDLLSWGPAVERAPAFPQRTNVEWVEILGPSRLRMRVWERGVGETQACGSGACAAAAAALDSGRAAAGEPVTVLLPGGTLHVSFAAGPGGTAFLRGPARTVFRGEWRLDR